MYYIFRQLLQRFWAVGAISVTFLALNAAPATATEPTLTLISPFAGIEMPSTPAGPDNVLDKLRRGFELTYEDNNRTAAELKWFASHPDYLNRVFTRAQRYLPYNGVRLTEAGRRLATHILRRHRLVEQFLVEVMGMDWSEVHPEAEILEHAVSDRLIERMDEMLGRPSVDPHGDPIPTACGTVDEPDHPSLLVCPLDRPLEIARVTDQRADFLRLLERHELMPGRRAVVRARDEMAETVDVHPEGRESLQLGYHAASRILVRTV